MQVNMQKVANQHYKVANRYILKLFNNVILIFERIDFLLHAHVAIQAAFCL